MKAILFALMLCFCFILSTVYGQRQSAVCYKKVRSTGTRRISGTCGRRWWGRPLRCTKYKTETFTQYRTVTECCHICALPECARHCYRAVPSRTATRVILPCIDELERERELEPGRELQPEPEIQPVPTWRDGHTCRNQRYGLKYQTTYRSVKECCPWYTGRDCPQRARPFPGRSGCIIPRA